MPLYVNDGKDPLDATGLDTAAHAATDHTGITGVPAAVVPDAETESVTVGTGLSQTRAIPGGTLAVNNERLEFEAWGRTGGGNGDISVTFGGQTIYPILNTTDSSDWFVTGTIIRTGATSQEIFVRGGRDAVPQTKRTVGTSTLANANSLVVTTTSGDVFALVVSKWAA